MKKPFLIMLLLWSATACSTTVDLRVMETTDLHMHMMDFDYYQNSENPTMGLVRTATLIRQARGEVQNSVLADNGDLIQGNPMGDFVVKGRVLRYGEVHPVFKVMNQLGYDVGNIGNHEFNYGLDFLNKALKGADFPYIVANVVVPDGDEDPNNNQPYFQPWLIVDKNVVDRSGNAHQLKVGFIGFVPPQIMNWDRDKLTGLVEAQDMVAAAKNYVPQMKAAGADVIIAIPHSGLYARPLEGMDEHAVYHLARVPGIDAILFGHSHRVFPGGDSFNETDGIDNINGRVFGVPAVMPGFWGSHLGIIDLELTRRGDGWEVANSRSEVRPIYERRGRELIPLVEPDPQSLLAIRRDHLATIDYMAKNVGVTTADINSYFSLVQDDPSVQIVSNAQTWYARKIIRGTEFDGLPVLSAAAPFKAGGRGGVDYFTDVPAGDIALRHVADLYVYPNDLKVVELTGMQVIEWLERSAAVFNTINPVQSEPQFLINERVPSYTFDVLDGISYEIDVTSEPRYQGDPVKRTQNRRIRNIQYDGKPLDEQQKFLVVTNSYRAGGGGHFPYLDGSTIVIDAPDKNRDVIAAYLLEKEKIDPAADNNWRFADTFGQADVRFRTSVRAANLAPELFEFLEETADGFGLYRLRH